MTPYRTLIRLLAGLALACTGAAWAADAVAPESPAPTASAAQAAQAALPATAASAPAAPPASLDTRVQDLKAEVIRLNQIGRAHV